MFHTGLRTTSLQMSVEISSERPADLFSAVAFAAVMFVNVETREWHDVLLWS